MSPAPRNEESVWVNEEKTLIEKCLSVECKEYDTCRYYGYYQPSISLWREWRPLRVNNLLFVIYPWPIKHQMVLLPGKSIFFDLFHIEPWLFICNWMTKLFWCLKNAQILICGVYLYLIQFLLTEGVIIPFGLHCAVLVKIISSCPCFQVVVQSAMRQDVCLVCCCDWQGIKYCFGR
jgi:hypothetical protein